MTLMASGQKGIRLQDFLASDFSKLPFSSKRILIEEFAAFVRDLHQSGNFPGDLYSETLLGVEEERVFFFFAEEAVLQYNHGALSRKQQLKNLGLLLSFTWSNTSLFQRLRFLKAYGVELRGTDSALIADIEKYGYRFSCTRWKTEARLALGAGNGFVREKRDGFLVYRVNSIEAEKALDALLPDPDHILDRGEIFKPGSRTHAGRIVIDGKSFFLKRYNCRGTIYRFQNAFRRSRAVSTWLAFWAFKQRDLPVAAPLLCLEERRFRLLGRTYLLMDFAEGTRPLRRLWPELNHSAQARLIRRLGCLLGKMHRLGCIHGDLKWSNILVRNDAGGRDIFLVDLDGARVCCNVKKARLRKDIKRFLEDLEREQGGANMRKSFLAGWKKWLKNI